MSDELPEGWSSRALPDVFEINPPKPPSDAVPIGTSVTFVPMPAVDADCGAIVGASTRPFAEVRKGYTAFADGDVLLAKITPCFENGKAAVARGLVNGLGFGSSEFHVFRSKGAVTAEFFFHYVRQEKFRKDAANHMTGTAGQARVPADYLRGVELPVPPVSEQQRIVTQVETLLEKINQSKARLARATVILKRFRQAVLAAALSGDLTKEWREKRQQADDSWIRLSVAQVCAAIVDCPHSTPKWTDNGEHCLRTTNFFVSGLNLREVRFVSAATYEERVSRLVPAPGDVVYSREGGILGIACTIPSGLKVCLGQRMMLMRPDPKRIRSDFLCAVLNSPATNVTVRELTGGSAAPHLNVGDIKKFEVPLPGLDEQDEVLRKMRALFALADNIEKRVKAATMAAEKLPQAILSKAFCGELVPTEAELARNEGRTYETAEELLAHVSAEPKVSATPKKTRKRESGARA